MAVQKPGYNPVLMKRLARYGLKIAFWKYTI
jgi:hypothetical protein